MSFWDEKEAIGFFKELPFCNGLIEKPYVKVLITYIYCMNFYFMMN